jgi:putative Mn2+ efflux pump MntP
MELRKPQTVVIKKKDLIKIFEGFVLIAIGIVFLTARFYVVELRNDDIRTFLADLIVQFDDMFARTWQNWVLGVLFMALGFAEIIEGVK